MSLLDITGMQRTDGLSMCSKPDHSQEARGLWAAHTCSAKLQWADKEITDECSVLKVFQMNKIRCKRNF